MIRGLILAALVLSVAFSFAQKINLTNTDLGRHIKNGENILDARRALFTNYYSYTEPDYPAINHHWGSGVIFFIIHKLAGFKGLSSFYILVLTLAFLIFFRIAQMRSSFNLAFLFSVLAVPLITTRVEIRPEGFSYLFSGICLYLLTRFRSEKIGLKAALAILTLMQIIWANLHIFFIIGPFLAGLFFLEGLFNKDRPKARLLLLSSLTAASFITPFGHRGVLEPFMILREYGYMLAENQSILFMQKRFHEPVYLIFEILFIVMLASFLLVASKKLLRNHVTGLSIMIFLSIFSWSMIRGLAIFGFFFLAICAENVHSFAASFTPKSREQACLFPTTNRIAAIISLLVILIGGFAWGGGRFLSIRAVGIGLMPGIQSSSDFFIANRIEGPIFNNYDIGGYLIFNLFGRERVFVDNRPEAYSVSFFKDIYVPMQEDEKVWKKMEGRYNFNVIYFYRRDITPWAQPFLIRRINDPTWAPVFVDDYTIILLKRNGRNASIINRYELPKGLFRISRGE